MVFYMESISESLSLLEQAEHKKQQLSEALSLIDRLGADIDWALDFCEYESIKEILSPISYSLGEAHEELESQLDRFIDAIEEYNSEKDLAIAEVERSSTLNHLLREF